VKASSSLTDFALTPDGHYVIAVGKADHPSLPVADTSGGQVKVWEVATSGLVRMWPAHGSRALCVACDPRGHVFITGGFNNGLRRWDLSLGKQVKPPAMPGVAHRSRAVDFVAFSPSGKKLLFSSGGGTWIIEPAGGKNVRLDVDQWFLLSGFSPDERMVAGYARNANARWDYPVRLWDTHSGQRLFDLPCGHVLRQALFHPDGRHLLTLEGGAQRNLIRVWDLKARRCTFLWNLPADGDVSITTRIAIAPTGDLVASCHPRGHVLVWSVRLPQ
jgi:WD40 repeat protein